MATTATISKDQIVAGLKDLQSRDGTYSFNNYMQGLELLNPRFKDVRALVEKSGGVIANGLKDQFEKTFNEDPASLNTIIDIAADETRMDAFISALGTEKGSANITMALAASNGTISVANTTNTKPTSVASIVDAQVKTLATEVQITTTSASFNAASSDMIGRFLDALGVERSTWLNGQHKGIWGTSDVQDVIAGKSPNEFLDALAKAGATPEKITEATEVVEMIKKHPKLAQAIHSATVKDKTMIEGLEDVDLKDLKAMVADPTQRKLLTDVMNKVADGKDLKGNDITYAHVSKLLEQHKEGDTKGAIQTLSSMGITPPGMGIGDMLKFFKDLMRNPEMAVNNLVNGLVASGHLDAEQANMAKGFLAPIAGTMKFLGKDFHQFAVDHDIGVNTFKNIPENLRRSGAQISAKFDKTAETGADGKVTHMSSEKFGNSFKDAMKGKDIHDPAAIKKALIKVDPKLVDEIAELNKSDKLGSKFNTATTKGQTLEALTEKVAQFHKGLQDGGTLDNTVSAMKL